MFTTVLTPPTILLSTKHYESLSLDRINHVTNPEMKQQQPPNTGVKAAPTAKQNNSSEEDK